RERLTGLARPPRARLLPGLVVDRLGTSSRPEGAISLYDAQLLAQALERGLLRVPDPSVFQPFILFAAKASGTFRPRVEMFPLEEPCDDGRGFEAQLSRFARSLKA